MLIAGIQVAPHYIVWLAGELIAAGNLGTAATRLHTDGDAMHSIALTALDREALLQVLEDPPENSASSETHSSTKTCGEISCDGSRESRGLRSLPDT